MVSGVDWDNSFDLNQQLHLPSTQKISNHYGRYIFIVDSDVKKISLKSKYNSLNSYMYLLTKKIWEMEK